VYTKEIGVEARVKYAKGLENYYNALSIIDEVMEEGSIISRPATFGAAKCHAALGDKTAARFLFGRVKEITDEYEETYGDWVVNVE
jgi:hypothetical protein